MAQAIRIPFNRATVVGDEMACLAEAIANGPLSGDGPFSRRCHGLLEQELGVAKALLTTSCTHALDMAALLLDIRPGTEVIVPAFTFVSSINAFILRGARPVFVDIRPDTLNLDEAQLERLITERTRAIVVVHYAGVGCEMDAIMAIAQRHNVPVVEDNAHGLFGKYHGRYLGTFGRLAALSFHETKNFTCGEGGALLISDASLIERAEIVREKGTNRSQFFRGEVDKYTWVGIGSSYLPSDMLAAFLYAQLAARQAIQAQRARVWQRYAAGLRGWAERQSVRLPVVPAHCEQAYHMFYLLLPGLAERQALISALKERGILSVFHYLPLHLSPVGATYGGRPGQHPVTERVSDQLLRLPFYYSLSEDDQADVIDAIGRFEC